MYEQIVRKLKELFTRRENAEKRVTHHGMAMHQAEDEVKQLDEEIERLTNQLPTKKEVKK